MPDGVLLVTGATGLIGSHVVERAVADGWRVRALVRPASPGRDLLQRLGVDEIVGDLQSESCIAKALQTATHVVHCAAMVGDWGPASVYRQVNVESLRCLLQAAGRVSGLKRFVAVSSLGVYQPRDHFGTDETEPPWSAGFDPYTRTKTEAELLVVDAMKAGLPAVVVRPGFVYGARDRHVLPRVIAALRRGQVVYFGSGRQLLNQVYVKNLVEPIMRALLQDHCVGEIFNITDDPLVSRIEFMETVARLVGCGPPRRHLPRWLARSLATAFDRGARWCGLRQPPPLSLARYKFLGLHLEYSIAKARRMLGYRPAYSFADGMAEAVAWFQATGSG